ncbi:MAG: M1 family aminopeptidase, partial [Patescibacteria group bacterium]
GVKVEILYNPDHAINIDQIKQSTISSLKYFNSTFGKYPLEYLRIVEFGSGEYAQAFAGSVTIGDAIFISKIENKKDSLNIPFYITSHEIAHQWFGHKLISAEGEGSAFLTESLAEYASNQVIKDVLGPDKQKSYMKKNLDEYLKSRKTLGDENLEKSLTKVSYVDNQGFVHYQKGAIALDIISRIISSEKLNSVINEFIKSYNSNPPYAFSKDLVQKIIDSTPLESRDYVFELLNEVVTYDNKIKNKKTELLNNKYKTTIEIETTKKLVKNGTYQESQLNTPIKVNLSLYENKTSNNPLDGTKIKSEIITMDSNNKTITIETEKYPNLFVLDEEIDFIDPNLKNNVLGEKASTLNQLIEDFITDFQPTTK